MKDAVVIWQEEGDDSELRRVVHPFETVLEIFPRVIIKDSAVNAICYGADLALPGIVGCDADIKENDLVQIQTGKGETVAVGTALMAAEGMYEGREGLCVTTKRVFMPRDVYPKVWGKS